MCVGDVPSRRFLSSSLCKCRFRSLFRLGYGPALAGLLVVVVDVLVLDADKEAAVDVEGPAAAAGVRIDGM